MITVRIECWREPPCDESEDGPVAGLTLTTSENVKNMRRARLLSEKAELEYTLDVETWRQANEEHHKRQGWKPYQNDDPCVDFHLLANPDCEECDGTGWEPGEESLSTMTGNTYCRCVQLQSMQAQVKLQLTNRDITNE